MGRLVPSEYGKDASDEADGSGKFHGIAPVFNELLSLTTSATKPQSGKYMWPQPSKSSAMLPNAGDISVNIGVFVAAILAHPEISLPGKYAWVKTEKTTFQVIMDTWSKVTGKDALYVEIPAEQYVQLWGPYGLEMSLQYAFGSDHGDWDDFKPGVLGPDQLHIGKDELVGLEPFLESVKPTLL